MRIMAAFFIVACVSMMLYVAPMALAKELGNQDVRVVLVPTNEEQVDLAPPEPRTNVRKTPSSVVNVSLSTLAEKKATVLDDSILDEDTCDAGCGDDCSGMFACRCCSQLWVRADYLLWWTRGSDIPPLVTTSTDQSDNGILGRPTTEILFGGSRQTSDARSSARITMGYWFDCCQCCGIQLDYFNLGPGDNNYDKRCDGTQLIARPFYNVITGKEASELVCKENVVQGRVRVNSDDYFDSFGIMGRWNIWCHQPCCYEECCDESCGDYCAPRNCGSVRYFLSHLINGFKSRADRIDFIAGYRNYNLDDNLGVTENLTAIHIPFIPDGTTFDIHDSFRAKNEFHGGELGLIATRYSGRWSLELLAKMALGNNSQVVDISGTTDIARPGDTPAHYDAGILALETNSGRYHRDKFVVIPQFGIELGYCLTERIRAYVGYNIIYWDNVVRAAEQIDMNVNKTYIPPAIDPQGPAVPAFSFQDSGFWAQGLNFGLECHF